MEDEEQNQADRQDRGCPLDDGSHNLLAPLVAGAVVVEIAAHGPPLVVYLPAGLAGAVAGGAAGYALS